MVTVIGLSAADLADRPQMARVVRADPRTGKLVRSVVVTSKPAGPRTVASVAISARNPSIDVQAPATIPTSLDEAVEQIAAQQSVPSELIHSVIKVESNYDPFAVSDKGAMGLMQLMPDTARRFGVADVFNPIDNIQGGAKYLRYLLDLYAGNYPLALAAYNAGERAVEKYGTIPPYQETRNYVLSVGRALEAAQKAGATAARKPAPAAAPVVNKVQVEEAKSTEPAHIYKVVGADGVVHYITR